MNLPASPSAAAAETAIGPRDLFAAHIIAALILMPRQAGVIKMEREAMAAHAYELADDMMRVRAK